MAIYDQQKRNRQNRWVLCGYLLGSIMFYGWASNGPCSYPGTADVLVSRRDTDGVTEFFCNAAWLVAWPAVAPLYASRKLFAGRVTIPSLKWE